MEDFDSVASGSSHDIPSHVMVERKMRMMRPAQFVHLSVGNMETGSLDQAMQIMTVAEAKGLGTNILILLHTWCVLRALDKSYEAEIYFDRACAIIATAERTYLENNVTVFEGSQLQVFAAYLVCIVHILKKNKSNFIKPIPNQQHSIAEAMLIEAMYIRHGHEPTLEDAVRWFGSCDTWIDVAETLRPTDFILLAEDAYWEAFIRNRHLNEPLIKTIEIKAESNRSVTALPFMLRALEVGRFNWFLRDFFRAVEGDERTEQIEDILDSFYIEDRAATKIQSVSRMRKHLMRFEIKKGELRAKKKAYNALVKKADMMGSYSVFRNAHRLYLIWREKARESREHKLFYLKRLKRYLQNHMVWLKYYRSNTRRAKMALKYISATQVNYDYTRIHYFHLWMYTLRMVELTRAANIIKFTLRQQKKEETLEWHLKTTTQIGFKRKAKTISKFMTHWRFRFEIKVRKRAAAIIRLIVRNVIRRHRLKLKMDKVEAAAAAVKKMIYSNTYQLMKRRWVKWQKIFKRNRKIWAVTALATHLPYILKKRCARLQFHSARRFVEIHDAVNYKHLYLNMESVFQLFYFLRSVYRIQRMIRLKIARINLRRRVKLICAVEDKWRECLISCRDRHWGQYKKYVVIWKETKEYSASIITLWWQRIHKSLKAVKARKHMKGSRLLAGSIYTMQTKRAFKRIGRSVAMIKQFISLNKMYAQLRIHYLRVAMTLFKEFDAYHKRIREIMHLTVHKKLGRIFYPGVHLSVHVSEPAIVPIFAGATNSIEASVEGPSIICQDIDKTSKTYEPFDHSRGGEIPYLLTVKEASCDCGLNVTSLEWEHYVKPRIFALRSMGDYAVLKSFQVMMATYRIRIRRLRSLSFMLAEHVSTHTLQQVSLRCASAHTIQRAWHCAAARIHLADRVRCARRLSELSRRLTALKPKRRRLFNIIKRGMFRRMAARLRLQVCHDWTSYN